MPQSIRRHRFLTVFLIGAALLGVGWLAELNPARPLERAEFSEVRLATNRLNQSLWDTGYRKDCVAVKTSDPKGLDSKYTCELIGEAAGRVMQAVGLGGRSYYVVRPEPFFENPVHVLSLLSRDGRFLHLRIRSLEEADQGIFYGYIAKGQSIQSDGIRWFRYSNPELGQVLRSLRGN